MSEAKKERLGGDAAIAIGEHAFRAGYRAASKRDGGYTTADEDDAWSDYDPPEDIKALT